MSGPRDPDDGAGWHEPGHLGRDGWEPPGWSLPDAQEQGVPLAEASYLPPGMPDPNDPMGMRGWAAQQGWEVGDGTAPRDAALAPVLAASPVRGLDREYRPANVVRGRYGSLELVAFDVVFPLRGRWRFEYAVTAVPLLGEVPGLRLSPARFWQHRTGGLLRVPGGDAEFDQRWVLLAAEDGPQVRRLAGDPALRGLLLASDDGDEFWTAAGHLAAIRTGAHRPLLLEHQARLLTAAATALTAP